MRGGQRQTAIFALALGSKFVSEEPVKDAQGPVVKNSPFWSMVRLRENSPFHVSENGLFSQNGLFLGPFQNGLSFTTGPRIPRSVRKQGLRFQVYYMAIKLYFLTFYPEELQNQIHPNILGPLVSTLGTLFLRPLHRREQRGGGGGGGRIKREKGKYPGRMKGFY